MEKKTFNRFRELVYDRCGISLGPGKEALVAARVGKRMRALGIGEYRDYLKFVTHEDNTDEVVHLLDAISTNVTSFFRESAHFDFFRDAMDGWLKRGQKRFRFWCAASSTGEEPYTIALVLREISAAPPAIPAGPLEVERVLLAIIDRVVSAVAQ